MLRIMKVIIVIMTAFLMQVSASTRAQQLTLKGDNLTLKQIFLQIRKQTGYTVLYKSNEISKAKSVDLSMTAVPLEDALKQILSGQDLEYAIKIKAIIITQKEEPSFLGRLAGLFDRIDVRGRVFDETGQGLAGATVIIVGGGGNTKTDQNGEFYFRDVDENSTLRISYVGYKEVELRIRKQLSIQMKLATSDLQEVVVNKGYYNTTKALNTGSVSKISGDDIAKQPVSDPVMALEGRVSGLYISQQSGIPGAAMKVRLRGQNSIANGNDPLYVIDGVPFESQSLTTSSVGGGAVGNPSNNFLGGNYGLSPFNNLSSSNIESIEVLKDADATAIYGSRGANGVILITTKNGRAGKTKVDLNIYSGIGKVTNKLSLMNSQQYLEIRNEAFKNDGITPGPNDNDVNGKWNNNGYTDWQKVLIGETAHFTNAQASISGGDVNTQFLISGGFSTQGTVFPGDYTDKKSSLNFNLNHSSQDRKFKAHLSASYINDNNILPTTDFTGNIKLAPTTPDLYNEGGELNWQNNTFTNPLSILEQSSAAVTNNLLGNLNLSYEILKGLTVQANLGYNHIELNQDNLYPLSSYNPSFSSFSFLRKHEFGSSDVKNWILEPQLNYVKQIGKGKLNILLGSTFRENIQTSIGQEASDFATDALIQNISSAANLYLNGNNYSQYKYNAIFGRINYNWEDKYLINFTARRDGSSRFGESNQFGNFGAIGAGWIFSKEMFFQRHLPFMSFGKLRASYGITGNDQISDYQYLSTYSNTFTQYQGISNLSPTRIPNPYFGWESVKKLEFGLETGFLNNNISFNINYYRNRTGNQLVGYPLPSFVGFQSVQYNLPATVQNTGFEFDINTVNFNRGSFNWRTSANLTLPKNKLVAYPNLEGAASYKNRYVIGESIFVNKYYHYTGVNPQTGLYTVQDVNGDGSITDPEDKQTVKEISQKFFGGLQNMLSFKGFELDFLIQFVKQTGLSYRSLFPVRAGNINQNLTVDYLQRWEKPGDITDFQKVSTNSGDADRAQSNYLSSDASIVDASYLRLKSVSISYGLPKLWLNKVRISNAKLYILGQNMFTLTNYKGLDPETQTLGLPPLRMITAGIQLGF